MAFHSHMYCKRYINALQQISGLIQTQNQWDMDPISYISNQPPKFLPVPSIWLLRSFAQAGIALFVLS